MKNTDVLVIGGGAAGLMTAVTIGKNIKNNNTEITILEHKDKPGKKLLATGNGRCNFTNDLFDEESYRGSDSSFGYEVIKKFDKDDLLAYLQNIGILNCSINGYYYPRSLQATSVLDAFIAYINLYYIKMKCNSHVKSVKKIQTGYLVETDDEIYTCKYLVLATGGKSYNSLGSDGSGYKLAKMLGHTVTPLYPSLTGLNAVGLDFKIASGVRAKGKVSLIVKDRIISEQVGEIQFADYGVSGIPVFQISRYASEQLSKNNKVMISIDLAREYDILDIKNILTDILESNKKQNILNAMNSFVPLKLAKVILKRQNITPDMGLKNLDNAKILALASELKQLKLSVTGDTGFEKAQVTAGGIKTNEINNDTMESKLSNNLFIVGELMDIDGNCGGYNLHFAFASGKIAGDTILERINENT